MSVPQNKRRVATAAFWHTLHHDGKLSPDWWGGGGEWGARPPPLSLQLPSRTYKVAVYSTAEWADTLTLHSPYFISINIGMYSVVCPLVRIGTPSPPQGSVSLLPEPKVGGGGQFGRLDKKPSTLSALWLILLVFHFPHSI